VKNKDNNNNSNNSTNLTTKFRIPFLIAIFGMILITLTLTLNVKSAVVFAQSNSTNSTVAYSNQITKPL